MVWGTFCHPYLCPFETILNTRLSSTILDQNVHNISIEGSFDDCQDIVKALFADPHINQTHRLGAVNSISFARILAQIVYYFHSYFSLLRSPGYDKSKSLRYVVPSGNFGDILAGWYVTVHSTFAPWCSVFS